MSTDHLPPELFTAILALTLPEPVWEDAVDLSSLNNIERIPPYMFLRVCRRWRNIVLATQRLWTHLSIYTNHLKEGDGRIVNRLLQQCLDRSGNLPLSLYLNFNYVIPGSGYVAKELERSFIRSQRRWENVCIGDWYSWEFPINVDHLAASPLRELRLSRCRKPLLGLVGKQALNTLSALYLYACHSSYMSLISCSPNLESLTLHPTQHVETHQYRLERLKALDVYGTEYLEHITSPSLRHFTVTYELERREIPDIQRFIERNDLELESMTLRAHWYGSRHESSKILPTLRCLPSLLSLHLSAEFDALFFDEMGACDPNSGAIKLCPMLQNVTLDVSRKFRDIENSEDLLARFIQSRWRSPNRALKGIRIGPSYNLDQREGFVTLTGSLEPVARFIEEGLDYKLYD